jgi:hypothetical protein
MCAPYFDHVQEAWAHRNNPNVLFIFYEDMKKAINDSVVKY